MSNPRKKVTIIGVLMDLGADRRGVDMGPSAVRDADLNERKGPIEIPFVKGNRRKVRERPHEGVEFRIVTQRAGRAGRDAGQAQRAATDIDAD